MSVEEFSPILSGLLGGLLAIWLSWAWERWITKAYNGRDARLLLSESRSLNLGASVIFIVGLVANIAVYPAGLFRADDWRGLGLVTGCTMNLILLWMWLWSRLRHKTFSEAFVTFAIYQKIPTIVFSGVFVGAEVLLFTASSGLLVNGR